MNEKKWVNSIFDLFTKAEKWKQENFEDKIFFMNEDQTSNHWIYYLILPHCATTAYKNIIILNTYLTSLK